MRRKKRETFLHTIVGDKRKGNTEQTLDGIVGNQAPYNNIEYREQHKLLREAMNTLPENQRIALMLSTYHELSYKEIAEVMDTSVSSVESLLFRAKNNLRKTMVKSKT